MFDPDKSTDDFDAPFTGVPDPAWDAEFFAERAEPYPAVPAYEDDPAPATWPLLILAVVAICSFAMAAKLIAEGQ